MPSSWKKHTKGMARKEKTSGGRHHRGHGAHQDIKGLYTYSAGQYKGGRTVFGQGGTEAQRLAPVHAGSKQRVDGMLAKILTQKEAHVPGLTTGTAEIPFAGDYATKGLYTYSAGRFKGAAFFGSGFRQAG
jgi:hypothetical protein